MEKLYTPEQLQKLKARYEKYPDQVKEVEKGWVVLFQQFEQARIQGLSPECEAVQKLAATAQHYIDLFTGGDKEIEANLDQGYAQSQQSAGTMWGVSQETFAYATQARQYFKKV